MFKFFSLLILIIVPFTFSGCSKKDQETSTLSGTYSGIFYYSYPSATFLIPPSGPVNITFSGDKYVCTANPNRVPAGGSGNFQVSNQQIQFQDANIWTANFDWGLILNGTYTYQIKSDSLILNKTTLTSTYQYRLKRIN